MYKYINTYTAEFLHWTGNGKPSTIVFADVFITKWKTNNSTLPDNTNAKLANGSAFFFFSFPFIWIAWIRGLYCVCIRKHVKEHTTNEKKNESTENFCTTTIRSHFPGDIHWKGSRCKSSTTYALKVFYVKT